MLRMCANFKKKDRMRAEDANGKMIQNNFDIQIGHSNWKAGIQTQNPNAGHLTRSTPKRGTLYFENRIFRLCRLSRVQIGYKNYMSAMSDNTRVQFLCTRVHFWLKVTVCKASDALTLYKQKVAVCRKNYTYIPLLGVFIRLLKRNEHISKGYLALQVVQCYHQKKLVCVLSFDYQMVFQQRTKF